MSDEILFASEPPELHHGDCLDVLKEMPDCSIDACVTDPPYGLSFMGKKWDYDVPSIDVWREVFRVLKPGGHLLAFAGTRTQHRMACAIEDAGFEIRDMIAWVYGCLDEQTQLVTPDGPRPYHSAKAGDPVLCYNVETKEYNYQPIQDVVVYDYSDTAYRLVGDHGEQVVSRNHRCLVERSRSEVFQLAETLEQQARVPILENLPALQQALRNARQSTSGQEQDLQQGVRGGDHRQGQQRPHADRAAQAQPSKLRGLRRRSAQSRFMAEARRHAGLQPAMQRQAPWRGMEAARQQGAPQLATRIRAGFDRANDRRHQSRVERWADLPQPQGSLCRSGDPVRALPCGLAEHGAEGWLHDGAPAAGGSGDWPTAHPGGSCASRQPRRDGQPAGEPDAVCDERPAQGIRAWSGHRTSVVRVEPFHYTGKVWCLKVPTGCFVAWRDGMAFPTGNSGFPKSLDVSKAIDRAAGALKPEGQGFTVAGYSHAPDKLLHTAPSKGYTPPAPATPEAQQWSGWGTALKPSIETVTWATKPFPSEGERDKILKNLWKIEARLWLLSSASAAAWSSTSSPSEYDAACATAQWTADDATNTRDALRGLMDTWQYEMATYTSLNIASSWRRTLEESSKHGSTSTTATESKTTIDWKTLSCCLSRITPESIIQASSLPGGFDANASTAERIFSASLALLQSTLTLSAIEPATWQELAARQGEAVKPSLDPCILARKPLAGTVAENVLRHGTGAINVDGCRVGTEGGTSKAGYATGAPTKHAYGDGLNTSRFGVPVDGLGRWPANLIHDGSEEVLAGFPESNSARANGNPNNPKRGTSHTATSYGQGNGKVTHDFRDSGSAARFFYTAKASRSDRGAANNHPTVKPTDLMQYLCRLVTPPGGVVLDPFMGSGTTIKAAIGCGFRGVGIERDPEYFAIAKQRLCGAQLGFNLDAL